MWGDCGEIRETPGSEVAADEVEVYNTEACHQKVLCRSDYDQCETEEAGSAACGVSDNKELCGLTCEGGVEGCLPSTPGQDSTLGSRTLGDDRVLPTEAQKASTSGTSANTTVKETLDSVTSSIKPGEARNTEKEPTETQNVVTVEIIYSEDTGEERAPPGVHFSRTDPETESTAPGGVAERAGSSTDDTSECSFIAY